VAGVVVVKLGERPPGADGAVVPRMRDAADRRHASTA
jgi:hypothetical protein